MYISIYTYLSIYLSIHLYIYLYTYLSMFIPGEKSVRRGILSPPPTASLAASRSWLLYLKLKNNTYKDMYVCIYEIKHFILSMQLFTNLF